MGSATSTLPEVDLEQLVIDSGRTFTFCLAHAFIIFQYHAKVSLDCTIDSPHSQSTKIAKRTSCLWVDRTLPTFTNFNWIHWVNALSTHSLPTLSELIHYFHSTFFLYFSELTNVNVSIFVILSRFYRIFDRSTRTNRIRGTVVRQNYDSPSQWYYYY